MSKDKEDFLTALSDFCKSFFKDEKDDNYRTDLYKAHATNEEKQEATFVVLSPDEYDLHNDIYDAEEIRKGCENYNSKCGRTNLKHQLMLDTEAVVIKSWITDSDLKYGDTMVKKGSWLQTWKFNDAEIWKGVKEGYYCGLSVQCLGEYIYEDED